LNEQIRAAQRLISSVELVRVRLVQARVESVIAEDDLGDGLTPTWSYSARAVENSADAMLVVRASLDCKIVRVGSDRPMVRVQTTLDLDYRLPGDLGASRAELKAFAATNGIHNAWPYFREYVQSSFARMLLPPLVLPVFRVGRQRTPAQEASEALKRPRAR
jgi:hypothetical protein